MYVAKQKREQTQYLYFLSDFKTFVVTIILYTQLLSMQKFIHKKYIFKFTQVMKKYLSLLKINNYTTYINDLIHKTQMS